MSSYSAPSSESFLHRARFGWVAAVAVFLFLIAFVSVLQRSGESLSAVEIWLGCAASIFGIVAVAIFAWGILRKNKDAENHIKLSKSQFNALATNVPGVIFQWYERSDGEFGFNYCSPRCEELFGFKAEEVLKDWTVLNLHPNDANRWAESIRDASRTLSDWFFEGRLVDRSGAVRWWRGIARPVRSKPNEVLFNGIMLDISEAKETEREVQQARMNSEKLGTELLLVNQSLNETNLELKRLNQQKNEFLGIAAHDLKNPLGGIVGFSVAMKDTLETVESAETKAELLDIVETIERSARHMLVIINELLDTAVLEGQGLKLECTYCDVSQIATNVVSLNQGHARQKGIRIISNLVADSIAYVDIMKTQDVVDNLLSNAIKYSHENSRVWLTVEQHDANNVRISVRDEGPGLTEEDMKKLFGKFQKLSARPTAGESSTGLGLSICKTIVELHGGRIWAEQNITKGAAFHVDLPVKEPAPVQAGDFE